MSQMSWKNWKNFRVYYDADSLTWELQIIPTIFECEPNHLQEVAKVLKSLSREKRTLVEICLTVIRIILLVGATSATPERSFLMSRSIKTWLRSRMLQKRLNSLSILYENKSILDDILLIHVANDFADHQPDWKNTLVVFRQKIAVDFCIYFVFSFVISYSLSFICL